MPRTSMSGSFQWPGRLRAANGAAAANWGRTPANPWSHSASSPQVGTRSMVLRLRSAISDQSYRVPAPGSPELFGLML